MEIEVLDTSGSVAQGAADVIANEARAAVAARGRFIMAVSGGHTPWVMLRALATADVPWPAVHVVQVDERVAPAGDPDRNLTHIRESLLEHAPLSAAQIHAMPVNIICMGGRVVRSEVARDLVDTFLAAGFSREERHLRRLRKIAALEVRAAGG